MLIGIITFIITSILLRVLDKKYDFIGMFKYSGAVVGTIQPIPRSNFLSHQSNWGYIDVSGLVNALATFEPNRIKHFEPNFNVKPLEPIAKRVSDSIVIRGNIPINFQDYVKKLTVHRMPNITPVLNREINELIREINELTINNIIQHNNHLMEDRFEESKCTDAKCYARTYDDVGDFVEQIEDCVYSGVYNWLNNLA